MFIFFISQRVVMFFKFNQSCFCTFQGYYCMYYVDTIILRTTIIIQILYLIRKISLQEA